MGFDSVHGGFGFGEKNEPGNSILDFALSYDLIWILGLGRDSLAWSLLEVDQVWAK